MQLVDRLVPPLTHRRLPVRFGALLIVATTVFVVVWSLAYLVLPEGLLRGRTVSAVLAAEEAADSIWIEWLRLLSINVAVAAGVFVLPNLMRTRRGFAVGNVAVLVMVTLAAVVTGTNSFSVQTGTSGSLAPSLEILGHPGPYELVAYLLATTSTYRIGRWQLEGRWPRSTAKALPQQPALRSQVWFGLVAATLLLIMTAAWETRDIINAVG
ncbi:MAG TPA: hypothetical protein VES02_15160 [Dermatophilaceae bacterium]|nr:hypothetical protein [Dermatophilaceae bacterium]